MALFPKTRRSSGWLAVSFRGNGFCAAHVARAAAGRPRITLAAAVPTTDATLAATLQRAGKEWGTRSFQFTTLLDRHQYQFLPVEAPNVAPTELKSAISWMVRDMIDFAVEEAAIDVLDVPADKNAPARARHMYAVVAHSRIIGERQRLFGAADIPLTVIDIPEMAQRNLAVLLEPARATAMVSFDDDGALLTITCEGELFMARRFDVTLGNLLQPESEGSFEAIADEVERSLEYFGRQFHRLKVAKLAVAPIGEAGPGLKAHLERRLTVPVQAFGFEDVLDLTDAPDLRDPSLQQTLFMTVGAALRHEEKVL